MRARAEDALGFAIAAARTGSAFRRAAESRGEAALTREVAYALTLSRAGECLAHPTA